MNTFLTILKIDTLGEKIMLIPNMTVRAIPDNEASIAERFYIHCIGRIISKRNMRWVCNGLFPNMTPMGKQRRHKRVH